MADLSPIRQYLDAIRNAAYGRDVRTAIYESISQCYTDVDDSKTVASNAADRANNSADAANTAANSAANVSRAWYGEGSDEGLASRITKATTACEQAVVTYETEIDAPAKQLIVDCKKYSDLAKDNAEEASAQAKAAKAIVDSWVGTSSSTGLRETINNSITAANTAASDYNTNRAPAIDQAISTANASASACDRVRLETSSIKTQAELATDRANAATTALNSLTVTSDSVGPDDTAYATITTFEDGHKNIHFRLKQGPVGPANMIKGDGAYVSVEALEADVPNPSIGDQYQVGTEPPYLTYRWTGTRWFNMGPIGIAFKNLSQDDVNSMWAGTLVDYSSSMYIEYKSLYYLINSKIKEALSTKVNAVNGMGLSELNFTTEYRNAINKNAGDIASLSSEVVTKVEGKGLSTNDFTDAYKNQITTNQTTIGTGTLDTTAKTLIPAVNELRSNLLSCMNKVLYFQDQSVKAASNAEVCRITNSLITTKTVVLEATFGSPAEVWDIAWQSYNGYIVFTGSVQAATTMNVTLGLKDN